MPATYWHELYQIERVLETALVDELVDKSLPAVIAHDSDEYVKVPRVLVDVQVRKCDDVFQTVDGEQYEFRWSGSVSVAIFSRRSDATQHALHSERIGRARWAMHNIPLINARMDYHELATLYEAGTNRSIDNEQDMDVCELHFDFSLAIKTDAWPEPET